MHLRDRGGPDGLGDEVSEDACERTADLLLHERGDGFGRRRRDVVLEARQLGEDVGRKELGASREHLAELHEHPTALFEREAQSVPV
jgi:hypothetical protein